MLANFRYNFLVHVCVHTTLFPLLPRAKGEGIDQPELAMQADLGLYILQMYETFPKEALVFMCLQHKSFENTVGKGEIAHDEQFLLLPQCFYRFVELYAIFHQI